MDFIFLFLPFLFFSVLAWSSAASAADNDSGSSIAMFMYSPFHILSASLAGIGGVLGLNMNKSLSVVAAPGLSSCAAAAGVMRVLAMGAVVLPAGSVLPAVLKIGIWAMGDTSDPAAVPAR